MGRLLGLTSERLGFGPATMQVVVHDHVLVTTPSRPDHWPGNALHLLAPPADLPAALARFDRSVGHLPGITRRVVAWETEGGDQGVEVPDDLDLLSTTVGVIGTDDPVPDRPVPAGVTIVRATDPPHWAGAKVLYLQTEWEGDEPYWRWHVDQQRRADEEGRGVVLVAYHAGIPIGRASLFAPGPATARIDHGVAVVEDVIVHPLHRGAGVASALVAAVADVARRADPRLQIVVRSEPGSTEADWYERLGFAPRSRTWTAIQR